MSLVVEKSVANHASQVLKDIFGFDSYRGAQEAIIEQVCSGGDAFVLMPTGGGKSLCYQIPSIVRKGTGIIISPLIALMQDQVQSLKEYGVAAEHLNSSLSEEDARRVKRRLLNGELDLLYVSPERLLSEGFLETLKGISLSLFAIDEAHCVSQWGHDFRTEYIQLDILKKEFPNIPRIALTATADELTRKEILARLKFENAEVFIAGFDRPNIRYEVHAKKDLRRQLVSFIRERHPSDAGIVYCLTRKKVEKTCVMLEKEGFRALPYHAGMSSEERNENQNSFLLEEGVIIVATVAFGMGIDKPNVRFVAHADLPKSVEGFYQETGRAGRDGLPSSAWMSYGLGDIATIRSFIFNSNAGEERKRIENHKLNSLLGVVETTLCRREVLLRYFGDSFSGPCGNCDNCLNPPELWDGREAAQQALSCVYRTGQKFGAGHLIAVLRGEKTEKVSQFGHESLKTFGVGAHLSTQEWQSVFRQLVAGEILGIDVERYGGFYLLPRAKPILKGEQEVQLRKDPLIARGKTKKSSRAKIDIVLDDNAERVFQALREKRLKLAKARNIPPYVIFHDSALREMAVRLPKDLDDFATISGVGNAKLAQYGKTFLEVILSEE